MLCTCHLANVCTFLLGMFLGVESTGSQKTHMFSLEDAAKSLSNLVGTTDTPSRILREAPVLIVSITLITTPILARVYTAVCTKNCVQGAALLQNCSLLVSPLPLLEKSLFQSQMPCCHCAAYQPLGGQAGLLCLLFLVVICQGLISQD